MKKTKIISGLLGCALLAATITVHALPSDWARNTVDKAIIMGIVPQSVRVNYQKDITRAEFCEMITLLTSKVIGENDISLEQDIFTDISEHPAMESILKAFQLGIVKGMSDDEFEPDSFITREQICTMMVRALQIMDAKTPMPPEMLLTLEDEAEISDWALDSVKYASLLGLIYGDENMRIMPKDNTTREQAVVIAMRIVDVINQRNPDEFIQNLFGINFSIQTNVANASYAIESTSGLYVIVDQTLFTIKDGVVTNKEIHPTEFFLRADEILYANSRDNDCLYRDSAKLTDFPVKYISTSGDNCYVLNTDDMLFYAVNLNDGQIREITETPIDYPYLHGSVLYYAIEDGLYKKDISQPNSEPQLILSGQFENPQYVDGVLYYIDKSDGFLYAFKDNRSTRISGYKINHFAIYKEWIYAVSPDGVYKIKAGMNVPMLFHLGAYTGINVGENLLYLRVNDGRVFSISTDGGMFNQIMVN